MTWSCWQVALCPLACHCLHHLKHTYRHPGAVWNHASHPCHLKRLLHRRLDQRGSCRRSQRLQAESQRGSRDCGGDPAAAYPSADRTSEVPLGEPKARGLQHQMLHPQPRPPLLQLMPLRISTWPCPINVSQHRSWQVPPPYVGNTHWSEAWRVGPNHT